MVPFDTESPFITSGMRVGTSAITTRGINKNDIPNIVDLINNVIENNQNEEIIKQTKNNVHELMSNLPLFKNSLFTNGCFEDQLICCKILLA